MYNEIEVLSEERNPKAKHPIQWETQKRKTLDNQNAKENAMQESSRGTEGIPRKQRGLSQGAPIRHSIRLHPKGG